MKASNDRIKITSNTIICRWHYFTNTISIGNIFATIIITFSFYVLWR